MRTLVAKSNLTQILANFSHWRPDYSRGVFLASPFVLPLAAPCLARVQTALVPSSMKT